MITTSSITFNQNNPYTLINFVLRRQVMKPCAIFNEGERWLTKNKMSDICQTYQDVETPNNSLAACPSCLRGVI